MLNSSLKNLSRQLHHVRSSRNLPHFDRRYVCFKALAQGGINIDDDIYQKALDNDEITSAADAINKGFAYLQADWQVYGPAALELFSHAANFDTEKKYTSEINCGIEQAKNACTARHLYISRRCFHTIKP